MRIEDRPRGKGTYIFPNELDGVVSAYSPVIAKSRYGQIILNLYHDRYLVSKKSNEYGYSNYFGELLQTLLKL